MGSEERPRTAVVTFGAAREAGRRVAGVAAAARIVRELAEAGFVEVFLVLPTDDALDSAAMDDVRRLAGPLKVRTGTLPAEFQTPGSPHVMFLPGNRLIPAKVLRDLRVGEALEGGIRLDGPGAAREILRGTGKAGDGPVSRWLNRPVSQRISALLLHVPGFRPSHATAGTAMLAVLMFVALVAGGAPGLIAGGLLFQAASIFDGVDGEVARATFRSSHSGAALDSAIDVATNLLLIVGLTVNLGSRGPDQPFYLAAWGFGLFVLGLAAIAWRAWRAGGPFSLDLVKHHYRGRFSGRLVPRLIGFATIVSSRDFFALLFALLIVAGFPMGVLYLFAAAASIWILFVAASLLPARKPALASESA